MNKKFDAVKFQQEQRAKISDKISKMSNELILSLLDTKSSFQDSAKFRRKRNRAKV